MARVLHDPSADDVSTQDELARDAGSRKAFLRMMGGGTAAAGLAGLLSACGGGGGGGEEERAVTAGGTGTGSAATSSGGADTPGDKGGSTDVEIVNYALTLEFLEASFYEEVEESGVVKDKKALELIKKFGATEREHAVALTKTVEELGGTPVSAPRTRFDLVIGGGEEMVLQTAATVENLGASAYLGQAPRIKSKEILAAALAIHTVEARHAAALNELVRRGFKGGGKLQGTIPDGPFAKPMSMEQVLAQAKPFLAN